MGGRTPLTNVYSAACAVLAMLFMGGAFQYLPKAALAVLIVDAMRSLLNWKDARKMWTVRARRVRAGACARAALSCAAAAVCVSAQVSVSGFVQCVRARCVL